MSSSASPDIREECVRVFRRRFGRPPQWLVRCPGRVNLIGEHIDYSDYSVLPMAIEDSTWVAVGTCPEREIQLENVDGAKYAPFALPIPSGSFASACAEAGTTPKWHHYFLAGWRGILEHLGEMGQNGGEAEALEGARGMCAVVGSRIPPSAGLSSSSALVCAAALATLCVQTDEQTFDRVSKSDLAEIATRAERFVGVEGGGMDQACECLAREGQALRIDFRPLRWTPVKLPPGALFAVLHSGKEMNKAASAYYNQRVVECRIAAQLIAKRSGCCSEGNEWHTVRTLKQAAVLLGKADHPEQMLALVDQHLQLDDVARAHTRAECCAALGCTDAELAQWSLNANTQDMREFWLAKRARHVYSEAARVLDFERACRENAAEALQRMAALMNASHASCAQLFECSCAELDAMVEACRRAGFAGARLTGAGWGGCVVALVDKAQRAKVEASGEVKVLFWSEPCEGIEAHAYAEEAIGNGQ